MLSMIVFNFQNKVINIKNDYLTEFSKKVVHRKTKLKFLKENKCFQKIL